MDGEPTLETRLADLQRAVEVGFAKMDGKMDVAAERHQASEKLHADQAEDYKTLRRDVDKHGRQIAWAYGVAAGCSGASGLIVWALTHH